ncbi:endonuclease NucS domain-containing protein [Halanaerobium sp. ST460_2HS_T2]|uniref:endonuclease NucS domain-containing protein n=1 Tax=Halanaerobium sp. ST460_2HS_T2 TaxID=2183914 RepID=UPI000DF23F27|nr:endonuclease NucS domain-containing protein [Halanaerobium sp. ST460_2HS_T2]RCW52235.1 uncharacterized protein DUF91 [Halanaerobium sp. ST460_2HS_T2]
MRLYKNSKNYEYADVINFKSENEMEDILFSNEDLNKIVEEELLIVGRQIQVENYLDTIDILAIDKEGKMVIIELKSSFTSYGTDADFQTVKYAAIVSKWDISDIKELYEDCYYKLINKHVNFEKKLDAFLDVDISYINNDQRIILIGTGDNEKLNLACSWMRCKNIDVKIVPILRYEDESLEVLEDRSFEDFSVNKPILNSQYSVEYHVQKGDLQTQEVAKAYIQALQEIHHFDYPVANQSYIVFKTDGTNIIKMWVNKKTIKVDFLKGFGKIARRNKVEDLVREDVGFSIADKINYGDEGHIQVF